MIKDNIEWWNKRFTVVAQAGISTGLYYPGRAEENHNKAQQALLHLKKQNKKGFPFFFHGDRPSILKTSCNEIESFLAESLPFMDRSGKE